MPFGRKTTLEALILPGTILVYKYNQFRQRRRDAANQRITERELRALHLKIERLLLRLDESELELPTSQEDECVICINARATMQTSPCGHRVVCRKCFVKTIQSAVAQRMLPLRCVICRTRVNRLKSNSSSNKFQNSAAAKNWTVPASISAYSVDSRFAQSTSLLSMSSSVSFNSGLTAGSRTSAATTASAISTASTLSAASTASASSTTSGYSSAASCSSSIASGRADKTATTSTTTAEPQNTAKHTHHNCSATGCAGAVPRTPNYQNTLPNKRGSHYSHKKRFPEVTRLPPIKEIRSITPPPPPPPPAGSSRRITTSPAKNPGARFMSYTSSSTKVELPRTDGKKQQIVKTHPASKNLKQKQLANAKEKQALALADGRPKTPKSNKAKVNEATGTKSKIIRPGTEALAIIVNELDANTVSRCSTSSASSSTSTSTASSTSFATKLFNQKETEKKDNKKNESIEERKREEKNKLKSEKEAKKEEKRLAKEEIKLAKLLEKEEKKRKKKTKKDSLMLFFKSL